MKSKHSKQKANKEINNKSDVEFFNDNLGENASEELKSEAYSNALKNDFRNSGMK
ncbi:MAG: hypothetical protein GX206_11470 [Clostridiales bacterium]|nr:hypothetical protein [Clostridiales bacterium]